MNTPDKLPSFVLCAAMPVFLWTVRVPVLGDNEYSFAALPLQFQAVDQAELDKMRGENLDKDEKAPTDEQICRRAVVGWPKLLDDQGQTVTFTPEALGQLLRAPIVRSAIVGTYLAAMSGMGARKNA